MRTTERGTLSPRELEILTLAAKGKTYLEAAQILGVSFATIHNHITNLKAKMNARNVAHAVARGYELGILELRRTEPRVMMAVRDRRILGEDLPVELAV
jgi:DNA-binding CsgD family transcriptional regulator